jgi:hypothetical protein
MQNCGLISSRSDKLQTNFPYAQSRFNVWWTRWWPHFQLHVIGACSNPKGNMCHKPAKYRDVRHIFYTILSCRRDWYIFYMIFQRFFCCWTSVFLVNAADLELERKTNLPYAPPRYVNDEHVAALTFGWTWQEHNLIIGSNVSWNSAVCRELRYIFYVIHLKRKKQKTKK